MEGREPVVGKAYGPVRSGRRLDNIDDIVRGRQGLWNRVPPAGERKPLQEPRLHIQRRREALLMGGGVGEKDRSAALTGCSKSPSASLSASLVIAVYKKV